MEELLVKKDALSVEKNVSDEVLDTVNELTKSNRLITPKNYIPANALKSAFLEITQKFPVVNKYEIGSPEYLALQQSLLEMVTMGLNPMKNQCYFIPRGNKLTLFKSYFGDVAAAKNSGLIIGEPKVVIIYEGDKVEVKVEDGVRYIASHESAFGNEDNAIIGAYCIIDTKFGKSWTIMTKKEIDKAWAQSSANDSKFQKNFPQEATKRTIIRRAIKMLMNSSTDENLVIEAYNHVTAGEYNENDNIDSVVDVTSTTKETTPKKRETKKAVETKVEEVKIEDTKTDITEDELSQAPYVESKPENKPVETTPVEEVKTEVKKVVKKAVKSEPSKNDILSIINAKKNNQSVPATEMKTEPDPVKEVKVEVKNVETVNEGITPEVVTNKVEKKAVGGNSAMSSILAKIAERNKNK